MNVLLINPPYSRIRGSGMDAWLPLGLGYLAAVLIEDGFEVLIYSADNCQPGEPRPKRGMREIFELRSQSHRTCIEALANKNHFVWREVKRTLEDVKPDLVGITALSVQYGAAVKVGQIVKEWRPDCPVIIGGHHVTYLPNETMLSAPVFDLAVLGEGEATFLEVCRLHRERANPDFKNVLGVAYRKNGDVFITPPRQLCNDLNSLPFPRRDINLYPETYTKQQLGGLIYGRGCPWDCRFCSSKKFWQRRVRMRSPENCVGEINSLMNQYGLRRFMFWDDAFSVRRKEIIEFATRVIESKERFTFTAATRADLIDQELVELLRSAGCTELKLGVESGSPRVLEMIRKNLDLNVLREAVKIVKAGGINLGLFFMAGLPYETLEDLNQTFDLIKELDADNVAFNIFDPMPGSDLYQEAIDLGLIPENADWTTFAFWPDASFTINMTPEEFDKKAREMADYIFKRNDSLRMQIKRFLPQFRHTPSSLFRKALDMIRS